MPKKSRKHSLDGYAEAVKDEQIQQQMSYSPMNETGGQKPDPLSIAFHFPWPEDHFIQHLRIPESHVRRNAGNDQYRHGDRGDLKQHEQWTIHGDRVGDG